MRRRMGLVLAIMIVLGMMIPAFAGAGCTETTVMCVRCSGDRHLNVRETVNGRILYQLENGTKVEVQSSVAAPEGWSYVTVRGHRDGGFVMTRFLAARETDRQEICEGGENFMTVTPYQATARAVNSKSGTSVGLRTAPDRSAQAIRRLIAGDILQVTAEGKTWSKVVDIVTGRTGYVANAYLVRQEPLETQETGHALCGRGS